MMQEYYYSYEGRPCRISETRAEIYVAGEGFVPGPRHTIEGDAKPISKREFDAMVMALALQKKSE
jgi:hypothetical protein